MNSLVSVTSHKVETMSSYEFWKIVNRFRSEEGENHVEHGKFIARVKDECSEISLENISTDRGKMVPGCQLDRDQMMLVGMRESKSVRKKVLLWLKKLEQKQAPALPDFTNPAEAARAWATEFEQKQIALEK